MDAPESKIKGRLGFGFMRLPMKGDEIDTDAACKLVDVFLENGFNYFDTAHGYHNGKSEAAIKTCLTSRYPREAYVLTNKLSTDFFEKQEDIRPLFENQLAACGVDYFDFYLMHAQTKKSFERYKRLGAYETALELQAEGKFQHFGISFHDSAEVLEKILTAYPQIEVVQLQFNYADYEDAAVQSRLNYEVCRKFHKKVLIMEPVKGGSLAKLPEDAHKILSALGNRSDASYAIRFAAGFEDVISVLSGMGTMEMLTDNLNTMKHFTPLTAEESAALANACAVLKKKDSIPCTACRYCIAGCPKSIPIPDLFACMNERTLFHSWSSAFYYSTRTESRGKASDCIQCGKCEASCPQHLPIRELLSKLAAEFETKKDHA